MTLALSGSVGTLPSQTPVPLGLGMTFAVPAAPEVKKVV